MDKETYFNLCDAALNFMSLPGENWNHEYQTRLFKCGLMLTERFPNAMPWVITAPDSVMNDGDAVPADCSWPSPSYIVPVPYFAPPVANQSELRDTLFLFREFYNFYVTQTKMGASHQHPIWSRIAELLGDDNNRKVTTEEYHFLTAPFWESEKHAKRD